MLGGGCAERYSHWNGSDITTRAGTEKLKHGLLEKRPRLARLSPLYTVYSVKPSPHEKWRSKLHRIQGHVLDVFL